MKIKTAGALLALCITGVFSMHAGAATIDEQFANDANSYTVKLSEDSDISSVIQIKDGKDVTLDLNGHTLTPGDKAGFYVNGATFTITDNSTEKCGAVNFANAPYSYTGSPLTGDLKWIYAENKSTLTIKDASVNMSSTSYNDYYAFVDIYNNSKLVLDNSTVASINGKAPLFWVFVNKSDIDIINSTINAAENGFSSLYVESGRLVMKGNSNIINSTSVADNSYGIVANNSNLMISDNAVISGNLECSSDIESTLVITGGTINGSINAFDATSNVIISGGTFATKPDDKYLAPGFSVETDDNGNFIVGGSTAKLATGSAVTAQGVDNTKATGFVTTISGVDTINSISWAVTGNGATKSTEVFEVGNVGGEGDVKIGLIIDGLDDSAAVAKATVNGTINE